MKVSKPSSTEIAAHAKAMRRRTRTAVVVAAADEDIEVTPLGQKYRQYNTELV